MRALPASLISAALGAAIIGGIFYGFSSFVMGSLGSIPHAEGVRAMQSVNRMVITPSFMVPFLGTLLVSVLLVGWLFVGRVPPSVRGPMLVGIVLYVLGTFGVTMLCNVPRNDALAALDAASAGAATEWARYLLEWTRWNSVRAACSLLASASFVLALVRSQQAT